MDLLKETERGALFLSNELLLLRNTGCFFSFFRMECRIGWLFLIWVYSIQAFSECQSVCHFIQDSIFKDGEDIIVFRVARSSDSCQTTEDVIELTGQYISSDDDTHYVWNGKLDCYSLWIFIEVASHDYVYEQYPWNHPGPIFIRWKLYANREKKILSYHPLNTRTGEWKWYRHDDTKSIV